MWNNRGKLHSDNFIGDVRLHVESADCFTQLEEFCERLKNYSDLEVVFYTWSETTGLAILISLKDPVPLVDKLRQMNIVEHAYKKTEKDIVVALNNSYTEIISAIRKTFQEGILLV
jgi:hypothetical protein